MSYPCCCSHFHKLFVLQLNLKYVTHELGVVSQKFDPLYLCVALCRWPATGSLSLLRTRTRTAGVNLFKNSPELCLSCRIQTNEIGRQRTPVSLTASTKQLHHEQQWLCIISHDQIQPPALTVKWATAVTVGKILKRVQRNYIYFS